MSWITGIKVRGGYCAYETIGISDKIPDYILQYAGAYGSTSQYDVSSAISSNSFITNYYNNDFFSQIDISYLFSPELGPYTDRNVADVALLNDDNEIVGFLSVYITRIAGQNQDEYKVSGAVKNASGVILGYFLNSPATMFYSTQWEYYLDHKVYLCLAVKEYYNDTIVSLYLNGNLSSLNENTGIYYAQRKMVNCAINMNRLFSDWGINGRLDDQIETSSPEYGDESTPEGYEGGSFDDSSDKISIDSKPTIGVTTAGFINVYKVEQNDLQNLGEKLFPHIHAPEFLDDPQNISVTEMLSTFVTMMYGALLFPVGTSAKLLNDIGVVDVLMNGKLIDYVIDCHIIPCSISGATVEGLKVGYRQFNDIQLARATEDYVDVDCGSLSIREYFANFLDFASCNCELWLPFVGYVPVDNEYWNGGTIQVKYRFNIIDGSFQAFVLSTSGKSNLTETIIAQYGGVACVHYPITGMQYANVISGLVNGTAGAVANGAGGNYAGVASNLMNMAMLRPENPSSNGYNASSGFLSKRTPYLVIKRSTPQFSKSYPSEKGLPCNITRTLSSVHGFTQIDNPVLHIDCNDREYDELVQLLKSGIIL